MRRPLRTLVSVTIAGSAPCVAQIDASLLSTMGARSIGPAGMSGRVSAVAVVESNPNVIYVGAATGGVWKSAGGALTWDPIFDDQPTSSIGAVAVFQRAPDIVWVGTGEGNVRNSAGVGNGIYRSMDGGDTWASNDQSASTVLCSIPTIRKQRIWLSSVRLGETVKNEVYIGPLTVARPGIAFYT